MADDLNACAECGYTTKNVHDFSLHVEQHEFQQQLLNKNSNDKRPSITRSTHKEHLNSDRKRTIIPQDEIFASASLTHKPTNDTRATICQLFPNPTLRPQEKIMDFEMDFELPFMPVNCTENSTLPIAQHYSPDSRSSLNGYTLPLSRLLDFGALLLPKSSSLMHNSSQNLMEDEVMVPLDLSAKATETIKNQQTTSRKRLKRNRILDEDKKDKSEKKANSNTRSKRNYNDVDEHSSNSFIIEKKTSCGKSDTSKVASGRGSNKFLHRCPHCTFTTFMSQHMKSHLKAHENFVGQMYTCDICGMAFSQKANMHRHRGTHSGVKPYECRFCLKRFFRKDQMQEHSMTHIKTGDDFDCPVQKCSAKFFQHSALRTHLEKDHKISQNSQAHCKRCTLVFSNPRRLLLHYQTKHDDELALLDSVVIKQEQQLDEDHQEQMPLDNNIKEEPSIETFFEEGKEDLKTELSKGKDKQQRNAAFESSLFQATISPSTSTNNLPSSIMSPQNFEKDMIVKHANDDKNLIASEFTTNLDSVGQKSQSDLCFDADNYANMPSQLAIDFQKAKKQKKKRTFAVDSLLYSTATNGNGVQNDNEINDPSKSLTKLETETTLNVSDKRKKIEEMPCHLTIAKNLLKHDQQVFLSDKKCTLKKENGVEQRLNDILSSILSQTDSQAYASQQIHSSQTHEMREQPAMRTTPRTNRRKLTPTKRLVEKNKSAKLEDLKNDNLPTASSTNIPVILMHSPSSSTSSSESMLSFTPSLLKRNICDFDNMKARNDHCDELQGDSKEHQKSIQQMDRSSHSKGGRNIDQNQCESFIRRLLEAKPEERNKNMHGKAFEDLLFNMDIFECPHCSIFFTDQTLYLLHKGLHSEAEPFRCNLCGTPFSDKYTFTTHIISSNHGDIKEKQQLHTLNEIKK